MSSRTERGLQGAEEGVRGGEIEFLVGMGLFCRRKRTGVIERALVGIAETKSLEVERMTEKGREFDLRRVAPVKRRGTSGRVSKV
jgi:hypothetical protein